MNRKFVRSVHISTLETYGYIETRKLYEISKEGVRQKLHKLVKEEEDEFGCLKEKIPDETRLLLKIDAGQLTMEEVYLVNPVFMALIIEDYECAEQLLDMGYQADDRMLEPQIYMVCCNGDINQVKEYEISITQWLFAKEGIPEQLFLRICRTLNVLMPIFEFRYDYWENPFYMSTFHFEKPVYMEQTDELFDGCSQEMGEENDIFGGGFGEFGGYEYQYLLPLDGFEKIYNMDFELLDGMLDENSLDNVPINILDKNCQKWIFSLIKYFENTDDIIPIIKTMVNRMLYCRLEELNIIVKILSEMKTACEYHTEARTLFFHEMIKWFVKVKERKEIKPRTMNKIKTIIRESYPEEYDLESYIEFILNQYNGVSQEILSYIEIWKDVLKRKFLPLWVDMGNLLDDFFEKTGKRLRNSETLEFDRMYISQVIDMVESIDGVIDDGYPIEEDLASFSLLVEHIIEVQSEELLLLSVEKNLLPREYLTPLKWIVLDRGYTKLMPSIIYMQSKEKSRK